MKNWFKSLFSRPKPKCDHVWLTCKAHRAAYPKYQICFKGCSARRIRTGPGTKWELE